MVILNMEGKTEELEQLFLEYPIPNSGRAGLRADLLQCRAKLLSDKGEFAEAEKFYRQELALRKQTFGNENSLTIETLGHLNDVLQRQGKSTEVEDLRQGDPTGGKAPPGQIESPSPAPVDETSITNP